MSCPVSARPPYTGVERCSSLRGSAYPVLYARFHSTATSTVLHIYPSPRWEAGPVLYTRLAVQSDLLAAHTRRDGTDMRFWKIFGESLALALYSKLYYEYSYSTALTPARGCVWLGDPSSLLPGTSRQFVIDPRSHSTSHGHAVAWCCSWLSLMLVRDLMSRCTSDFLLTVTCYIFTITSKTRIPNWPWAWPCWNCTTSYKFAVSVRVKKMGQRWTGGASYIVKAESSKEDPKATGGLVSNLPHPWVNKTKQHTPQYERGCKFSSPLRTQVRAKYGTYEHVPVLCRWRKTMKN